MRVAIVSDHETGEPNGISVSHAAILSSASPDLDIRLYTVRPPSHTAGALHRRPMGLASQLRGLYERLVFDEVDVIHIGNPGLPAVLARRVAGRLDIPLVATHRALPRAASSPDVWLEQRFLRWLYGPCVHVFVPSE